MENTEHHRLEAETHEANQRMMLMLDTSPFCTQIWDKNLNITDCNEAAVRLYGLNNKQEYIDSFIKRCSPKYQLDGQLSDVKAGKMMRRAFESGYERFDWMHQIPGDGIPTPLPAEITLVRARYGGEDVIIGYTRDLREHNKMMKSIKQRDRLLNAVNEAAALLLTTKDDDDVDKNLYKCMELVGRANKVDRVHIWMNDQRNDKLYHKCAYSWFNEIGIGGEDLYKNLTVASEDVPKLIDRLIQGITVSSPVSQLSDPEQEFFTKFDLKSVVLIPLFLDDQFWGIFSFDDCLNERIFTEEEISILRSFSLIMASSINRHALIAKRTREAEELTTKKYEYASRLKDVLAEITKSPELLAGDLHGAACIITDKVCDVLKASSVGFWLHKPLDDALINVVSFNSRTGLSHTNEFYDLNVRKKYASLLKEERIISMQSLEEIMEILPMLRGINTNLCASLDAPVILDGELVAVIGVEQMKTKMFKDRREWMMEEQSFMSSIADLIALAISNHERRRAREEAEAASQTKSIFLAKMSHEIRTPMNAIMGLAELALREKIPDSVRDCISSVKQAGANLLSIINDILDLSKIESGTMQITPTEYSLSSLINDVISIIRIKAFDSRIRLTVNIDSMIPNALIGDETRIRQVLINILGNAVKFTDIGYVSFSLTCERSDDEDQITLIMEVKDSGRGIKEENLEKLFDDYYQPDSDSGSSDEGTGLGLAISHNITKAMNGNIAVESEFGKGSTFTVTIPQKIYNPKKIAEVNDPHMKPVLLYERREIYLSSIIKTLENLDVQYKTVSDEDDLIEALDHNKYAFILISFLLFNSVRDKLLKVSGESQIVLITEFGESIPPGNWNALYLPVHAISLASALNHTSDNYFYGSGDETSARFKAPKANVLVVDDISTNLKVANGLLLPYEMNVDLCKSGFEAIDAVQSKHYDIIFMDHRMPGIDGMETANRIRNLDSKNVYYRNVPIIALTANAVSGMKEMFLQSGFDEFMSKPIDTIKLDNVLEKYIPKSKQINSGSSYKSNDTSYAMSGGSDNKPNFIFTIEGVDVERGVLLTGGRPEFYTETLATFYIDGKERKEELIKYIAYDDLSMYITNIHALKSAAANIGAVKTAEAANILETAAIENDSEFIKNNTHSFLALLDKLLNNIHEALTSYGRRSKQAGGGIKSEELKTLLRHLKISLEDFEIDEINRTIEVLLDSTQGDESLTEIRKISKHILLVEYDEAISTIDELLNK